LNTELAQALVTDREIRLGDRCLAFYLIKGELVRYFTKLEYHYERKFMGSSRFMEDRIISYECGVKNLTKIENVCKLVYNINDVNCQNFFE